MKKIAANIEKELRNILLREKLIDNMDDEIEYTLEDYTSASVFLNVISVSYPLTDYRDIYVNEKSKDYIRIFHESNRHMILLVLLRDFIDGIYGYRISLEYQPFVDCKKEGDDDGK